MTTSNSEPSLIPNKIIESNLNTKKNKDKSIDELENRTKIMPIDNAVYDLNNKNEEIDESSNENKNILHDSINDFNVRKNNCLVYMLSCLSAIGGFLFGYDTGVVSGAILLLRDNFQMTYIDQEIFVSVTMAAAAIFSLLGGLLNDWLGRKPSILIASAAYITGSIILANSFDKIALIVGRFVLGIGIGLSSTTIPMYISECAPPNVRGKLVTLFQLFITGGQFIASLICGAFSYNTRNGWRYMLGLPIIPGVIQLIGFSMMPESPRWLYLKGNNEKAKEVFMSLMGSKETAKSEIKDIEFFLAQKDNMKSSFFEQLKLSHVRKPLFIGIMLQFFQQFIGINTVMYYSATMIEMAGVVSLNSAIWLASIIASINFIFTFVAFYLVDMIGRRKLMLFSLSGTLIGLLIIAIGYQITSINFTSLIQFKGDLTSCSEYNNCDKCLNDKLCGFCYSTSHQEYGTCLSISAANNTKSRVHNNINNNYNYSVYENNTYNQCILKANLLKQFKHELNASVMNKEGNYSKSKRENESEVILTKKYCPSYYSWVLIAGMSVYVAFFAQGIGPLPWIINSEIFSLKFRSTGSSVTTTTNWVSNLIVSLTFLSLSNAITKYGAFYLYSGFNVFALIFIYFFVPETRNLPLEEIEYFFKGPWIIKEQHKYQSNYGRLD